MLNSFSYNQVTKPYTMVTNLKLKSEKDKQMNKKEPPKMNDKLH